MSVHLKLLVALCRPCRTAGGDRAAPPWRWLLPAHGPHQALHSAVDPQGGAFNSGRVHRAVSWWMRSEPFVQWLATGRWCAEARGMCWKACSGRCAKRGSHGVVAWAGQRCGQSLFLALLFRTVFCSSHCVPSDLAAQAVPMALVNVTGPVVAVHSSRACSRYHVRRRPVWQSCAAHCTVVRNVSG